MGGEEQCLVPQQGWGVRSSALCLSRDGGKQQCLEPQQGWRVRSSALYLSRGGVSRGKCLT